LIIKVRHPKK